MSTRELPKLVPYYMELQIDIVREAQKQIFV